MPRYSGIVLSFLLVVVCLGTNLVMYPSVWRMLNQGELVSHSEEEGDALFAQSEENGSEPEAQDQADRSENVTLVAASAPQNDSEEDNAPKSEGTISVRSTAHAYGPIPASAVESRRQDQIAQSEPSSAPGENEGFQRSEPNAPYANRFDPRSTSEKTPQHTLPDPGPAPESVTTRKITEKMRDVKPIAPSQPVETAKPEAPQPPETPKEPPKEPLNSEQDYNNLEGMSPLEKVEAFRDSPLDFDRPTRAPSNHSTYQYYRNY